MAMRQWWTCIRQYSTHYRNRLNIFTYKSLVIRIILSNTRFSKCNGVKIEIIGNMRFLNCNGAKSEYVGKTRLLKCVGVKIEISFNTMPKVRCLKRHYVCKTLLSKCVSAHVKI